MIAILLGGVAMYADQNNQLFHDYHSTGGLSHDPTTPITQYPAANSNLADFNTAGNVSYFGACNTQFAGSGNKCMELGSWGNQTIPTPLTNPILIANSGVVPTVSTLKLNMTINPAGANQCTLTNAVCAVGAIFQVLPASSLYYVNSIGFSVCANGAVPNGFFSVYLNQINATNPNAQIWGSPASGSALQEQFVNWIVDSTGSFTSAYSCPNWYPAVTSNTHAPLRVLEGGSWYSFFATYINQSNWTSGSWSIGVGASGSFTQSDANYWPKGGANFIKTSNPMNFTVTGTAIPNNLESYDDQVTDGTCGVPANCPGASNSVVLNGLYPAAKYSALAQSFTVNSSVIPQWLFLKPGDSGALYPASARFRSEIFAGSSTAPYVPVGLALYQSQTQCYIPSCVASAANANFQFLYKSTTSNSPLLLPGQVYFWTIEQLVSTGNNIHTIIFGGPPAGRTIGAGNYVYWNSTAWAQPTADPGQFSRFTAGIGGWAVLGPGTFRGALAESVNPIGDLSPVVARELEMQLQWFPWNNRTVTKGGIDTSWGFFLTTNASLYKTSNPTWNPYTDSSVALFVEMTLSSGTNTYSMTLFVQQKFGETLQQEDSGNCSGSGYLCLSGQQKTLGTIGAFSWFQLNYTGSACIAGASCSGAQAGANANNCTQFNGGPGCTYAAFSGDAGPLYITNTAKIPILPVTGVTFYAGFFLAYAQIGSPMLFCFDAGTQCGGQWTNIANGCVSSSMEIDYCVPNPQPSQNNPQASTDSGGFVGTVGRFLGGVWNTFTGAVGGAFNAVVNNPFTGSIFGGILNALTQFVNLMAQGAILVLNSIGTFLGVGNIGTALSNFFSGVATWITSIMGTVFTNFGNVVTFIANGLNIVGTQSGNIWGQLVGASTQIQNWASGAWTVLTAIGFVGKISVSSVLGMWFLWGTVQAFEDYNKWKLEWFHFTKLVILTLFQLTYYVLDQSGHIAARIKGMVWPGGGGA